MTQDPDRPRNTFCGQTRREFLWEAGGAFTSVALAGMFSTDDFLAAQTVAADGTTEWKNPLAARPPHFDGPAKAVIFLFMYGGPSQVDTFDYKPDLYPLDGKTIEINTKGRGGTRNQGRVVGPKWRFKQYGECGKWVSDLFPNVGGCVDDIAFIHSMTADAPLHGSAMLQMNSGRILSGSPALGSWVNYGLGTENENLPGFVVMLDPTGGPISGAKNWSSGYMPASYQGTVIRSSGTPILALDPPPGMSREAQRRLLDRLREYNEEHAAPRAENSELAARIASYELAYRMQQHAPEAVDLSGESEEIRSLYGLDQDRTKDFGRRCLLARRLVERGVRFIQDLKQRGLLDSTLVIWGGEFGRQPTAEYAEGTGRDHNAYGFTMWMAGGGIKGGTSVGETDELGNRAEVDRFHVKNLHATVLQQLGLDPNALSYFHAGLDQKLVGVEGAEPIHQIVA